MESIIALVEITSLMIFYNDRKAGTQMNRMVLNSVSSICSLTYLFDFLMHGLSAVAPDKSQESHGKAFYRRILVNWFFPVNGQV